MKLYCAVNEQVVKQTADLMVSSGLAAAGYSYLVIDGMRCLSRLPTSTSLSALFAGVLFRITSFQATQVQPGEFSRDTGGFELSC